MYKSVRGVLLSILYKELINKEIVRLVTHNGRFHADDVASYAILDIIFPNNVLHRTRDVGIIESADIVFDVGGGQFDHHMSDKKYRACGLPYASVGLIWEEFGRDFVRQISLNKFNEIGYVITDDDVEYMFKSFDTDFVKPLDAGDNGVDCVDVIVAEPYSVYDIVNSFNMPHLFVDDSEVSEIEFEQFKKASEMLKGMVRNYFINLMAEVVGNGVVREAFENRVDPRYVELNENVDWENELRRLDVDEEVLYVIYRYESLDEYRIQVVRKYENRFEARKDLPAEWGGLRDGDLAEMTGVEDAVFCHTGLFLGVTRTREGIFKLLEIALGDRVFLRS